MSMALGAIRLASETFNTLLEIVQFFPSNAKRIIHT